MTTKCQIIRLSTTLPKLTEETALPWWEELREGEINPLILKTSEPPSPCHAGLDPASRPFISS